MAILIDMPMPKTCYYCKFDVCGFCMVEELQKKDSDAKPDWCPLREVVRCKDRKNASESLVPESVYCDEMDRAVYIQGFCHHGERRGRMSVEEMIGKTISDVKVDGNR